MKFCGKHKFGRCHGKISVLLGTATTRRPRRPRKAAHMPASPAHSHQFAMNRPILQCSFSEMPAYPSQMQSGIFF